MLGFIKPGSAPISVGKVSQSSGVKSGPQLTTSEMRFGDYNENKGAPRMDKAKVAADVLKYAYDNRQSIADTASKFMGSIGTDKGQITPSGGMPLSYVPDPKEVSLNSGQPLRGPYSIDGLNAKENECASLHLTSGAFNLGTTGYVTDYFTSQTSFEIIARAQENISFNITSQAVMSVANLKAYFQAVGSALQLYYYMTGILSYTSPKSNPEEYSRNDGMRALSDQITATMRVNLDILKGELVDSVFPPRMHDLLRYMSATFLSGPNQNSALLKIIPFACTTSNIGSGAEITAASSSIMSTTNREIASLLRTAIPQWRVGEVFDIPDRAVYDRNFLSIFANFPFTAFDSISATAKYYPQVGATDTNIAYNAFSNELDAVAVSLCGVYDTTTNRVEPGLFTPVTTNTSAAGNSRRSYYEVSSSKGFYIVKDYPFLVRSRAETYTVDPTGLIASHVHLPGCDKVLGISRFNIEQTMKPCLDYLWSVDTITNTKMKKYHTGGESHNTVSKGKTSRRKKGGK